jgi:hypothetical protein
MLFTRWQISNRDYSHSFAHAILFLNREYIHVSCLLCSPPPLCFITKLSICSLFNCVRLSHDRLFSPTYHRSLCPLSSRAPPLNLPSLWFRLFWLHLWLHRCPIASLVATTILEPPLCLVSRPAAPSPRQSKTLTQDVITTTTTNNNRRCLTSYYRTRPPVTPWSLSYLSSSNSTLLPQITREKSFGIKKNTDNAWMRCELQTTASWTGHTQLPF